MSFFCLSLQRTKQSIINGFSKFWTLKLYLKSASDKEHLKEISHNCMALSLQMHHGYEASLGL